MPIRVDEDLIGVVVLVRRESREHSATPKSLSVGLIRGPGAIALTNARLIEAVERQRAELSRFLSPQVAELITGEGGEDL